MVWTQAQGGQACWPYAMARRLGERSDLPQGLPVDRVWPFGTEDSLQLHPGGPFTLQGSARIPSGPEGEWGGPETILSRPER